MRVSTLKPGFLISLNTSIKGGVSYQRTDLRSPEETATGAVVSEWNTIKKVDDPEELERATKVRGKCRSVISSVCAPLPSGGMVCPLDRETELRAAIEESRRLATEHNRTANRSGVSMSIWIGRFAGDDAEAVRAMSAEVRSLIDAMQDGIKAADPEAIREAANKARTLGAMLTADAAGKVNAAIEEARTAARAIVKRVTKEGEDAAAVISELKIDALTSARFAFLDLDAPTTVEAAPIVQGAIEIPAIEASPPAAPEWEPPAEPPPIKTAPQALAAFEF